MESADPDKLKRLLALALDNSSADGEALNALKAARKMVTDLGGVDKAVSAMAGSEPRNNGGGQEYGFKGFTSNDFWGGFSGGFSGFRYSSEDIFDKIRKAAEKKAKEEAAARQAAEDAEREAKERRDWELKRAMGQGLPIWEALRRRKLWQPDEDDDDILEEMNFMGDEGEEMAKFNQWLKAGK